MTDYPNQTPREPVSYGSLQCSRCGATATPGNLDQRGWLVQPDSIKPKDKVLCPVCIDQLTYR